MDIEGKLRKIALRNAILYDGKPDKKSVISNAMADKELKENREKVLELVPKIIEEITSMAVEDQTSLANDLDVDTEVHAKPQREGLPDLPNKREGGGIIDLDGNVVTRFSPNPNAPIHLGNARALVVSYLYAKKYNGKFVLRFDDTDPKVKVPMAEAYDWILDDMRWLGIEPDYVYHASDKLDVYIERAYEMYKKRAAYVCTCEPDIWRPLIAVGKPCPCRDIKDEDRWHKFLHEMKEGEAVLRIKTNLGDKNPAVRDWPAMRIIENAKHPRVEGYRIWPLYNFASAIDDHEFGITHIIRGQEHTTNWEKQKYIFKFFGWDLPIAIHHGRLSIEGAVLSKSEIKEGVDSGKYNGWDDPQLATLMALKKRGISSEAIIKTLEKVGIRTNDAIIDINNLFSASRKSKEYI